MKRFSFVVLFAAALAIALTEAQEQQCPPGQEWTTCGSACPPSCNSPPNQACTMQCIIGCQCRRGLLLNAQGNCVQPSQC